MARGESVLRFTPEDDRNAMAVFAECSDLREFGCRVLEATMNAMMDAEAQRQCGAARGPALPLGLRVHHRVHRRLEHPAAELAQVRALGEDRHRVSIILGGET